MAEKLGYYVYLYVDPRDGKVFYIGKGKDERCLDHLFEDDEHPKVKRIRRSLPQDSSHVSRFLPMVLVLRTRLTWLRLPPSI